MKKKNLLINSATTAIAIVLSLILACLIILVVSEEPGKAIAALLTGPLSSVRRMGSILTTAVPIAFTGLAVCIMFQAGMMNMCAEGAFFLGALGAAAVATSVQLPGILGVIVPMLTAALVGAVLCGIPAVMRAKLGASEMVSSLMLNYIALYLGLFLLNNFLRDQSFGALATNKLPASSVLPKCVRGTSIHVGVFLAAAAVVLCYLFVFKTKTGFRIRTFGQNSHFAACAGISGSSIILLSQILGGAIAGLGGSVELMGMYDRFQWTNLPGYGWDGIMLAILARNKPQYIPLAALFLAYLRVGAAAMATNTDVPSELITVIQAIMIMLVTAQSLQQGWKQKMAIREGEKK
jgi:ABC-type uncharacterized transport system permease subunit